MLLLTSKACNREKTSEQGNVVLAGQQTHHESAGNGMGSERQTRRSNVPQRAVIIQVGSSGSYCGDTGSGRVWGGVETAG